MDKAKRDVHDQARLDFGTKRMQRDDLEKAGDRPGALRAHRESEQIVKDYRKGKS
jgi:hypothetical protein